MDTKLKNSKLRPIIKAIVLILTLVFAFLAGTNGLELARKTIYFNNAERIQDTPAYKENVQETLRNLLFRGNIINIRENYYSQNLTFEQFCESSELAKNIKTDNQKTINEAISYFDQITEIKKLEPKQDGTYYDKDADAFYDKYDNYYDTFESFKYALYEYGEAYINVYNHNPDYEIYEEPVTSPRVTIETTTPYVDVQNNTTQDIKNYETYAEWQYEYQKLRNKIFSLVDDARSHETIKAELQQDLVNDLKTAYAEETVYLEDLREEYQNIDFLVINKSSGFYISNFTEEAEIENLKKNLKNDALYYLYFDGTATVDATEMNINTKANSLLNVFLYDALSYDYSGLKDTFSGCEIYIKINQPVIETDEFYTLNNTFIENSKLHHDELSVTTTIFSVLAIIGIIALAILSKPKYVEEKLKLTFNQRMFFIIQLCIFAFFVFCAGAGIVGVVCVDFLPESMIVSNGLDFLMTTTNMPKLVGVFLAIMVFFTINFINYIVVNKKANTLKERFICYKSFKVLRKIAGKNKDFKKTVKQIEKKLIIIIAIWLLIELIVFSLALSLLNVAEEAGAFFIILFILITIVGLIFTLKFLGQVKSLALAVENMKNGNLDINLDSTKFVFPLKDFARNLNECRDSIEKAVGEALKGERLKTELITNVSHDLKTPLTSIINYVSLLKLCNIEGEDENKYLDILDEKSTKLKRLIEDLTEASKASSGNIKMIVDTVNLNELALQAVGENNDVLENVGLEIVLSQKDNDLFVKADSQHTFRIFDNLFSNVKKYALSGTRVYVDVYKENGYGVFSVKNISKDKLNINPDEITERFVRGDNSRTTEGSGLGLSIARSFTELQNGIFEIQIDGDLFKVTIKLPITNKPIVK